MKKLLSWDSIREQFKGKWIELTDLEWDWNKPFPNQASVKNSAQKRSEIISRIQTGKKRNESVVLFVSETQSLVAHDETISPF